MAAVTTRREPHISLRQHLTGWAFALPFVIIFLVFMAGPILASLVLSFTDFGLRDLRNPLGTNFIGLDNYVELAGRLRRSASPSSTRPTSSSSACP